MEFGEIPAICQGMVNILGYLYHESKGAAVPTTGMGYSGHIGMWLILLECIFNFQDSLLDNPIAWESTTNILGNFGRILGCVPGYRVWEVWEGGGKLVTYYGVYMWLGMPGISLTLRGKSVLEAGKRSGRLL